MWRPFDEQKVLDNIKLCATDKVPRLGGFNMNSFHSCSDIIKEDIADYVKLYISGTSRKSINICDFNPKREMMLKNWDFRHVSLIGSVYKIISEVLTKSLKKTVYKLDNECNFIAWVCGLKN